jgi:C4-dicarboxylate transporter DctQ subunit
MSTAATTAAPQAWPLRLLDRLEEVIITVLMGLATLVTFAAVVHRYGAGVRVLQPILLPIDMSWAQELAIYMFVWMVQFGAAYGVRTGVHVGVDFLVNRLPGRLRGKVIVTGLLACAGFTAVVTWMGVRFVLHQFHSEQVTPDLEWPTWIVYLCVPLGMSLMSFRFLQVTWRFLRTGHLPTHDVAHVEGVEDVDIPSGQPGDEVHPLDPDKEDRS